MGRRVGLELGSFLSSNCLMVVHTSRGQIAGLATRKQWVERVF